PRSAAPAAAVAAASMSNTGRTSVLGPDPGKSGATAGTRSPNAAIWGSHMDESRGNAWSRRSPSVMVVGCSCSWAGDSARWGGRRAGARTGARTGARARAGTCRGGLRGDSGCLKPQRVPDADHLAIAGVEERPGLLRELD